jgi:hypothetical protein
MGKTLPGIWVFKRVPIEGFEYHGNLEIIFSLGKSCINMADTRYQGLPFLDVILLMVLQLSFKVKNY